MYEQMTRRHNRVGRVVVDALLKYQADGVANFREDRRVEEEGLSAEVRALRPDMSFLRRSGNVSYTELLDISCPYGRIMGGDNTLENSYDAKITKYTRLADGLQQSRRSVRMYSESE
jgi:hypothetical protein